MSTEIDWGLTIFLLAMLVAMVGFILFMMWQEKKLKDLEKKAKK